jgi:hypothetical protein
LDEEEEEENESRQNQPPAMSSSAARASEKEDGELDDEDEDNQSNGQHHHDDEHINIEYDTTFDLNPTTVPSQEMNEQVASLPPSEAVAQLETTETDRQQQQSTSNQIENVDDDDYQDYDDEEIEDTPVNQPAAISVATASSASRTPPVDTTMGITSPSKINTVDNFLDKTDHSTTLAVVTDNNPSAILHTQLDQPDNEYHDEDDDDDDDDDDDGLFGSKRLKIDEGDVVAGAVAPVLILNTMEPLLSSMSINNMQTPVAAASSANSRSGYQLSPISPAGEPVDMQDEIDDENEEDEDEEDEQPLTVKRSDEMIQAGDAGKSLISTKLGDGDESQKTAEPVPQQLPKVPPLKIICSSGPDGLPYVKPTSGGELTPVSTSLSSYSAVTTNDTSGSASTSVNSGVVTENSSTTSSTSANISNSGSSAEQPQQQVKPPREFIVTTRSKAAAVRVASPVTVTISTAASSSTSTW